jgi:hypothetical protein
MNYQDAWIASLSSGDTVVEHWVPDDFSPWTRLMNYCKDHNIYLTNLRLTVCSKTIALKPNALGYWQAHQQSYLLGAGDIPIVRGIGFVDGDIVKIVWGIRTPTNQPYFWSEKRSIEGQGCIIWSPSKNTIQV